MYEFDAFGGIYAVDQNNFEQQMNVLRECKIKVASLDVILNNKVSDDFCVALTFDDGNPSDFDFVFPTLKEFGFTATFFLMIRNIEKKGVTWEQYRKMYSEGFNIGSHGLTHQDLSTVGQDTVINELLQSKTIIEEKICNTVKYFSLPFGIYNSNIVKTAQRVGYKAIFTTHFAHVQPEKKPFVVHRWSIKRNTPISVFESIVRNHSITFYKYHYNSIIKKAIVSTLGTSTTNKIYTFKNKYF